MSANPRPAWMPFPMPAAQALAAPVLIVVLLAMLVLPLPPFLLDVFFSFNIAVALVVLLVAFTIGRGRALASPRQRQALWMLAVVFYVWTLSIGNGRYFIVGLLMVGPLLVMAWQWLPGSRTLRGLLLLGFVGLQWQTVQSMYRPGSWLLAGWRSGPSVVLEDTPLQRAPAVFLTLSSNGYGALVPRFHAQSRWVNLGHQMVIGPGQPEYKDVRALLTAPLPKYLVAPADPPKGSQVAQPSEGLRQRLNQDLHHHQLALADELCSMVRSNLLSKSLTDSDRAPSARAFWICPLRAESSPVPPTTKPDEATLAAFSSVDFPAPFGPTTAMSRPVGSSTSTSHSTGLR